MEYREERYFGATFDSGAQTFADSAHSLLPSAHPSPPLNELNTLPKKEVGGWNALCRTSNLGRLRQGDLRDLRQNGHELAFLQVQMSSSHEQNVNKLS